jgi:hypothetical protein
MFSSSATTSSSKGQAKIIHPQRIWAPSYRLDRLPKLTSPENYQRWYEASEHVLQVFGYWEIIVGTKTEPKAELDMGGELTNKDEIEGYKDRYQYTSAYFLETVDPACLIILTIFKTLSVIWKALQNKFARENTTSYYSHLISLLNFKMESKSKISNHLTQFDTNWNHLQHWSSIASKVKTFKLPFVFKTIFESLEAKATLLLYILPSLIENIADNF